MFQQQIDKLQQLHQRELEASHSKLTQTKLALAGDKSNQINQIKSNQIKSKTAYTK